MSIGVSEGYLSPDQTTAILVALAAVITALTGLMAAVARLYIMVRANHEALNGRVDQLVATARVAGHAEGMVLAHQLETPPEEKEPE